MVRFFGNAEIPLAHKKLFLDKNFSCFSGVGKTSGAF
jgi:hypothetical protein